jgi:hypothetical protein
MKHIAQIQIEFLKQAEHFSFPRKSWDKWTLEQQKEYLRQHPASKKRLTGKPAVKKVVDIPLKHDKDAITICDSKSMRMAESETINKKNIISIGNTRAKHDAFGNVEYYYTVINTNRGKKYVLPETLLKAGIDPSTNKRNDLDTQWGRESSN